MNKCLIILITFLIIKSYSFGQSITIYDGSKFSVGDTIFIGFPLGKNLFNYIKYYNTKYKSYMHMDTVYNLKNFYIIDIYEDDKLFLKKTKVVEIGKKGLLGFSFYIDIENAVRYGEVISSYYGDNLVYYKDVVKEKGYYLLNLKYNNIEITHKITEEYLYRYEPELYNKIKADEFEYQTEIVKQIKELKETVNKINDDYLRVIKLDGNLSNYDFSNNTFPIIINYLFDSNKFRVIHESGWYKNAMGGISTEVDLIFQNWKQMNNLPVDTDIAQKFVKRKKDEYGNNLNRNVTVLIYFKTDNQTPTTKRIKGKLYANIEKIEVYDFNEYYNLIGTIR